MDNGAGCCRPDKAGRHIRWFSLPTDAKKPIRQDGLLHLFDAWQFPTLAWGDPTLPSALRRFTSEFGMGSGGTTALQPPGKFFVLCTQFFIASAALAALANLSHILQYAPSVASLAALLLRKLLRTTICNLS